MPVDSILESKRLMVWEIAEELRKNNVEEINRRRRRRMTVSDGKSNFVYFRCYNCLIAPFDTISWFRFDPHSRNLSSSSSSVTVDPIWTGFQSHHSAVVGLDSLIYCLGGCDPVHSTSLVTVFEPLNPRKGWVEITPMLLPRAGSGFRAVASDGKIYAFGGLLFSPKVKPTWSEIRENWVEVYDPSTETWSFLEPLYLAAGHDDKEKKHLFDFLNPHAFEIYNISVYVADGHRLLLSCASWPSGAPHKQVIVEYIFDTRSHSLLRPGDVGKAFPAPFGGDAFMVDFSGFLIEGFNFKKSCWQLCNEEYISVFEMPPRPDVSEKDGVIVRVDDISSHAFRGGVHLLTDLGRFRGVPSRCILRYQKFDLTESVDAYGNETMTATPVSQIDVRIPSDQVILGALLLHI